MSKTFIKNNSVVTIFYDEKGAINNAKFEKFCCNLMKAYVIRYSERNKIYNYMKSKADNLDSDVILNLTRDFLIPDFEEYFRYIPEKSANEDLCQGNVDYEYLHSLEFFCGHNSLAFNCKYTPNLDIEKFVATATEFIKEK
uniref:Uncharacterized protein n=1 Tax=Panagrolaimus sp. PS1159 TaxID=55785 RepID=A0AC35F057_9BILA